MSNRNRRYSKRELLGSLYVDYVMSVQDLGVAPNSSRWEILREFLRIGEARAERLIEEPGGLLFLQSVAGQPNSGAIYVYNESLRASFLAAVRDEGRLAQQPGIRLRGSGLPPPQLHRERKPQSPATEAPPQIDTVA
jgi:hypothetical protein